MEPEEASSAYTDYPLRECPPSARIIALAVAFLLGGLVMAALL